MVLFLCKCSTHIAFQEIQAGIQTDLIQWGDVFAYIITSIAVVSSGCTQIIKFLTTRV